MKFCGSCGQQIPDNANACPYCGAFQDNAVPAAKAKKAFPVKAVLGIVLALAVLAGGFFAVRAIFGGGWEKPLKEAVAIANDKKVSEDAIQDLARCAFGTTGDDELDAAIAKALDLKVEGEKLLSELKDSADRLVDRLDDEYGKDWEISYEITSKEAIDSDDLEDYEDVYHDLAKLGANTAKMAKNYGEDIEDYTDGDLKEKDVKAVADDLRAFCAEMKDCKITKGYELEVTFTIEGKEDDDEIDYTIAVIKLDGKWVVSACYDDLMDLAEEIKDMDAEDLFYELF